MTHILTEDDVRVLLDMPTALDAVEQSFRSQAAGEGRSNPRRRVELPNRVFLNYMAAADRQSGWMGAKVYSVARGVAQFVVLLYRADTGELAAIIEADYLGQMRTGAATGIATKYMSRSDSRLAAIIGTGLQARTQLEAICRVRSIEQVRAFGRDKARCVAFCREMSETLGIEVIAVESAEDAVRDADIVITATTSVKPVLSGSWLAPGMHVNAMGSNFPQKRELDGDAVARAKIIAVDTVEQAQLEAGDLIQAFGEDTSRWDAVVELAEIVAGKAPGRRGTDEITLFKSVGIATWDIAAAARVLERAQKEDVGRQIPFGKSRT